MKKALVGALALLMVGAVSPAFAQGVGVEIGPVGAGISFAPEQRTRIKEYVVKERVPTATIQRASRSAAASRPMSSCGASRAIGARPSVSIATSIRTIASILLSRPAAKSST